MYQQLRCCFLCTCGKSCRLLRPTNHSAQQRPPSKALSNISFHATAGSGQENGSHRLPARIPSLITGTGSRVMARLSGILSSCLFSGLVVDDLAGFITLFRAISSHLSIRRNLNKRPWKFYYGWGREKCLNGSRLELAEMETGKRRHDWQCGSLEMIHDHEPARQIDRRLLMHTIRPRTPSGCPSRALGRCLCLDGVFMCSTPACVLGEPTK